MRTPHTLSRLLRIPPRKVVWDSSRESRSHARAVTLNVTCTALRKIDVTIKKGYVLFNDCTLWYLSPLRHGFRTDLNWKKENGEGGLTTRPGRVRVEISRSVFLLLLFFGGIEVLCACITVCQKYKFDSWY